MELDLQSLFGLYVHSCTHRLRDPAAHPPFGLVYDGAIGQPDRRHLVVTLLGTELYGWAVLYFDRGCGQTTRPRKSTR
jgi:hypothetical protein